MFDVRIQLRSQSCDRKLTSTSNVLSSSVCCRIIGINGIQLTFGEITSQINQFSRLQICNYFCLELSSLQPCLQGKNIVQICILLQVLTIIICRSTSFCSELFSQQQARSYYGPSISQHVRMSLFQLLPALQSGIQYGRVAPTINKHCQQNNK